MLGVHDDHESHGWPNKRPRVLALGQNMEVTDFILKEKETQILQEEIIGCDHLSLSSLTANCCVQSDSAFCMTSSTSRLSNPETCDLIVGCKCRCWHEARSHDDQFGYLLVASDEELGIPTEIHDAGAGEINGLFSDLQSLEAASARAWNAGHENSVCNEEVGDLEVWEMGGECDDYGVGSTCEAVNCFFSDLERNSPVYNFIQEYNCSKD